MNPINEWFCRVLCIGHVLLKVFRRYPHLSVMSLPYVTDMEHEYPYPHETGPTGQLTGQLSNSIVASRFGHVSICSDAAAAESTGFRRHVDGATLQLHGQQGTGTWLPRYSHCLTSACCSGYEYGEHGEHSGQVR
jgi:hypothetical protein